MTNFLKRNVFRTERLNLRHFEIDDVSFVLSLLNSEPWIRNIGDKNVKTKASAEQYILNHIENHKNLGYGYWVITLKDDTPIGIAGLLLRNYLHNPDLGFALLPQYFGKSYAWEVSVEILKFAQLKLHLKTIHAVTKKQNLSSIELLKKLGFYFSQIMDSNSESLILWNLDFTFPTNSSSS